jgi:eukaryotic-like serine/threonine-protein kinase
MIGTRLGHYEITDKLGEGGMGVVYRASDTKLSRDVAIKVLPNTIAQDRDRMERFRREAQLLAQLNHPAIAGIYGVEESNGQYALVMEVAEGRTLAERLDAGPISLDDALPIAKQIAEALEAAHERGIIHRDLKPANVKVSEDGQVKVLDFGLAKALEGSPNSSVESEHSPTLTMAATQAGVILGTAAYMSPEQARGKTADKRADIWSFGVVLFEMLTGGQLFSGETVSDSLAGVLRAEINLEELPNDTPESVRRVLRRCLVRDRRNRLHDIADVRIELEETGAEPVAQPQARKSKRRAALPWLIAVAGVFIGIVLGTTLVSSDAPSAATVKFEIPPPEGSRIITPAISPDGTMIAYATTGLDGRALLVRSLKSLETWRIEESEFASSPFWSPDSRQLGFYTGGEEEIRSVDIETGAMHIYAGVPVHRGSSLNQDGVLVYSSAGALLRVDQPGAEPQPVVPQVSGEAHLWPTFLPDGEHLLYMAVRADTDYHEIRVASLSEETSKRITSSQSDVRFAGGNLLFRQNGALMAQPFDADRMETTGVPRQVADSFGWNSITLQGHFSASNDGTLVYAAPADTTLFHRWFSRSGTPIGPLTSAATVLGHSEISPDGRSVAVDTGTLTGTTDIWIVDVERGVADPLTSRNGADWVPEWSPDGKRIAFTTDREDASGRYQIYATDLQSGGAVEPLLVNEQSKHHMTWSPDGKQIVYEVDNAGRSYDLWVLPLEGNSKPYELLATRFVEGQPRFSPDGRWLAYISDASGQMEVYVNEFRKELGRPVRVSTAGGISPRWREDGKEMYYLASDGTIMAVPVEATGDEFRPGNPKALFKTPLTGLSSTVHFTVTGDGERFLLAMPPVDEQNKPLTVVLNWTEELGGAAE